ncbi:hypothetical protein ACJX0J_008874, partial [Zea mays]
SSWVLIRHLLDLLGVGLDLLGVGLIVRRCSWNSRSMPQRLMLIFVPKAVRAIGRCAIKLERAAERCISVLLELIKIKVNYVVQEAIIVIKDIFRRYPNTYESIIATLCESLDTLDEPEAKPPPPCPRTADAPSPRRASAPAQDLAHNRARTRMNPAPAVVPADIASLNRAWIQPPMHAHGALALRDAGSPRALSRFSASSLGAGRGGRSYAGSPASHLCSRASPTTTTRMQSSRPCSSSTGFAPRATSWHRKKSSYRLSGSEAIIVIKDIFRRYPNTYESIIATLCESLDTLDEPEAKPPPPCPRMHPVPVVPLPPPTDLAHNRARTRMNPAPAVVPADIASLNRAWIQPPMHAHGALALRDAGSPRALSRRCAIKLERADERCISVLLELIKIKVNYVVQEAIIVIKDIFRRYPNTYESIIATLCESLDTLDEPEAK